MLLNLLVQIFSRKWTSTRWRWRPGVWDIPAWDAGCSAALHGRDPSVSGEGHVASSEADSIPTCASETASECSSGGGSAIRPSCSRGRAGRGARPGVGAVGCTWASLWTTEAAACWTWARPNYGDPSQHCEHSGVSVPHHSSWSAGELRSLSAAGAATCSFSFFLPTLWPWLKLSRLCSSMRL